MPVAAKLQPTLTSHSRRAEASQPRNPWPGSRGSRLLGPAGIGSSKLLQSALCKGAREEGVGAGEQQASHPAAKGIIINIQGVAPPSWGGAQALELSCPGSHPSSLLTCCVTLGELPKLSEPLFPHQTDGHETCVMSQETG